MSKSSLHFDDQGSKILSALPYNKMYANSALFLSATTLCFTITCTRKIFEQKNAHPSEHSHARIA